MFPNNFNVYLHDTPADSLFNRAGRDFSHGCVRVERPLDLAKFVLRDQLEWTEARIESAMHAGSEQTVKLRESIPVYLAYFTAWEDHGTLQIRPDVYGHDRAHTSRQHNYNSGHVEGRMPGNRAARERHGLARKDFRLMIEAAGREPLTVFPAIAARMDEAIAAGHGKDDMGAIAAAGVRETR